MSDKPSFVLYLDLLSVIDEMDDEQTARLFRLIKAYNETESENAQTSEAAQAIYNELIGDPVLKIIFAPFRKRFEADKKRYEEMIEANRANGRKGGAPKGNRNAAKRQTAETPEVEETTETTDRLNLEEKTTETTEGLKKQPKQPKTSETSETSRYDMICNDMIINNTSSNEEDIIKKEKLEKEKKKKEKVAYASIVMLTPEEYEGFVAQFGESGAKELIQILNDYKEANGKRYKSDAAAIRSWVVDKYLQRQKPQTNPQQYGRQQQYTAAAGTSEFNGVEGDAAQTRRKFRTTL